jgi:hypothetical protein
MARRTNKQILHDAKAGIAAIAAWTRLIEQRPGIREGAEYLISPENNGRLPAWFGQYPYFRPEHSRFRVTMAEVRDTAIFRLWGASKVVYAMDDDLLGYLSESSASAIPTDVLRSLPHANPYVLLPVPDLADPDTAYYRAHIGVPFGAFVFGRYRNAQLLCSTNDERREDLGLMFLGFIEDEDTPDLQTVRCTIPLRDELLTVESVVTATIAGFTFNESLPEEERSKFEAWLRRYVALVFNSLVYVCTDQPDIETHRPALNKAGKVKKSARHQVERPRMDDISEVVQLGFRLGPALNEARRQWEQKQRQTTGTGTRLRPHQRRGHFQTFWTGTGRTVRRVRWIAPYWVNQELAGAEGPQTAVIRRVKKRS